MRTVKKRPVLRIRAFYYGKQPLVDVYADVLAQLFQSQRKTKSSVCTFDRGKQSHYDLGRKQKERDHNGTND